MNGRKKALIVYARYGDGHLQAATALSHSLNLHGEFDAKLVDLLAESHPILNDVSRFVYRSSYRILPQVYGWVYESTKDMQPGSRFSHWLHSFGALKLLELVERESPDAVIHTFPSLALPFLSNRLGRKIPMFNVVTDFDLHGRWVHPEVDKYYVATEELGTLLCGMGVAPHRVAATGIPLRPSFSAARSGDADGGKYGLDPSKPVVLVMAGAGGVLSCVRDLCAELAGSGVPCQVAVVCGRNRALEMKLRKDWAGRPNVFVFGYVERIDELMNAADCIVTKPGGLTLSEAIAARLPIFLYRPVPGQERNNAIYLRDRGAAVVCSSPRELTRSIRGFLENASLRAEMRRAIGGLRQDKSAERIALDIVRQLHIMEESSAAESRV